MRKLLMSLMAIFAFQGLQSQVVQLEGPRFGLSFISDGSTAQMLERKFDMDSAAFAMDPNGASLTTQYGWQWEKRFADNGGDVVGLVEWVVMVAGMEKGMFLPSLTTMVGVRGKSGFEFGTGPNTQKVELVTLVKDAVFIYPNKDANGVVETLIFDVDGDGVDDETNVQGRFLEDSELTLNNEKPYVIYGYAAVAGGKTLDINPGARIHFHANSGLLITENASLHINGLPSLDAEILENEIIIQGDRLEPLYEDIPGQWEAIWLLNGSIDNSINHATIKNGTIGILSDGNQDNPTKLTITNSQIYNSSNFGILGRGSSINAENVVLNISGISSFAGTYGGNYNFTHSTIANYWSNSFRQFPALLLNNFIIDAENTIFTNPLESANFTNCIIYGNDNPELLLEKEPSDMFNFKFTNSLIYFDDPSGYFSEPQYDFSNTDHYENVIFNNDPGFLDPSINQLNIPIGSPAEGAGISYGNLNVDITNTTRTSPPDLGAYNAKIILAQVK